MTLILQIVSFYLTVKTQLLRFFHQKVFSSKIWSMNWLYHEMKKFEKVKSCCWIFILEFSLRYRSVLNKWVSILVCIYQVVVLNFCSVIHRLKTQLQVHCQRKSRFNYFILLLEVLYWHKVQIINHLNFIMISFYFRIHNVFPKS